MALPTLDRRAEEGPFNLSMACSSAGNKNDDSDDKRILYFAVYTAKSTPPLAHIILTTTLSGRGYYYAHFTDMESKALRSDLPNMAWFTCSNSNP